MAGSNGGMTRQAKTRCTPRLAQAPLHRAEFERTLCGNNNRGAQMRKYLLAAVTAAAISSPALARDNSPYVGIEAGVAMSDEEFFDVDFDGAEFHSGLNVDYKLGIDVDLIGGYDFGMFRAEAEIAYKRLGIEDLTVSGPLLGAIGGVNDGNFDVDGHASVLS